MSQITGLFLLLQWCKQGTCTYDSDAPTLEGISSFRSCFWNSTWFVVFNNKRRKGYFKKNLVMFVDKHYSLYLRDVCERRFPWPLPSRWAKLRTGHQEITMAMLQLSIPNWMLRVLPWHQGPLWHRCVTYVNNSNLLFPLFVPCCISIIAVLKIWRLILWETILTFATDTACPPIKFHNAWSLHFSFRAWFI